MSNWTPPVTRVTGDLITAAIYNAEITNNFKAALPVGHLDFFVMASAGAAVENLIGGAWLECNNASVLRATYPAYDTYVAALTPARPFGTVDGTHVSVPDLFGGRSPLHLGSNARVSTLGSSDGVAAANRRGPLHRHTAHTHTPGNNGHFADGYAQFISGGGQYGFQFDAGVNMSSVDGGSGTSSDPLDGGAYQVAGIWAVKAI